MKILEIILGTMAIIASLVWLFSFLSRMKCGNCRKRFAPYGRAKIEGMIPTDRQIISGTQPEDILRVSLDAHVCPKCYFAENVNPYLVPAAKRTSPARVIWSQPPPPLAHEGFGPRSVNLGGRN